MTDSPRCGRRKIRKPRMNADYTDQNGLNLIRVLRANPRLLVSCRLCQSNLLSQHFAEELDGARITGFTEGANRLFADLLVRVSPGDLNQKRH